MSRWPEIPGSLRSGVSRRNFIKGVIASGCTVASSSYLFQRGARGAGGTPGGAERLVTLTVNGQQRRVDVLAQETLAMTLRYKLGLTGTKIGCDRGECGACTVLLNDTPVYSCSLLTHTVRGAKITTIEGLAGPKGELHPVQRAFVEELGPQCGFCTPGQVMSAVALLKARRNPTRAETAEAMSGNLCRCGAYEHFLNAVKRAAELS